MSASNAYDNIVLGFAEPPDEATNLPQSFASKAGGLPVWLHRPPASPPPAPRCRVCNQPQQFLLQVYAPLESDVVAHDHAFHRVLTLVICRNPGCRTNSNCVSVLRAQLPRTNPYYPWDAHDQCVEELLDNVCHVCGFLAHLRCGGCRKLMYCGRLCQMRHWKNGHKSSCGEQPANSVSDSVSLLRFNQVEIVTDNHPRVPPSDIDDDEHDERNDDDDGDDDATELDKSQTVVESNNHNSNHRITASAKHSLRKSSSTPSNKQPPSPCPESPQSSAHTPVIEPEIKGTFQDADEDELPEDLFKPRPGRVKDPVYDKFSRIVSYAPDQVVRYEHRGRELWGCESNQCHSVPDCELCGSKRIFEMQVMPQLVYYISEPDNNSATIQRVAERLRDDMDWITICVYTCEKSCTEADGYVLEFGWLQRHPTS